MARDKPARSAFALPTTRTTVRHGEEPYWDIKFWPYIREKDDPVILAICGSFDVHVCQLTDEEESGLRFLMTFRRDEDKREGVNSVNSCAWCYLEEDDPLLAIAGESGHLQIIRPFTGELVYTLIGHGVGVVNDLTTHPKYPWIIASCAIDSSIRIWDLRRASVKTQSTCIIVCGHSLAHKEGLISIGWHDSGHYLVSGGFDHKVCVWTIPDLSPESVFWHEISREGRNRSSDEVRVIYYPHFITSAVHSEYVDSVMFWHDFILSKAAREDKVVLWKIAGFDSTLPAPLPESAPKAQEHLETRSGFSRVSTGRVQDSGFVDGDNEETTPFERLLEFHNQNSASFYMRFGLLRPSRLFPDLHTVLSVGDNYSRLKHWDIDRFITGEDEMGGFDFTIPRLKKRGTATIISKRDSIASSSRSPSSAAFTPPLEAREPSTDATSLASDHIRNEEGRLRTKYPLHMFEEKIKPHTTNDGKNHVENVTIRGVGWSVCGRWCVAVGEAPIPGRGGEPQGAISVLDRARRN